MLEVGQTVEDFTLPDQHGEPVAWSSLRGKPVVVFFYPKASTPGCTTEACGFRDEWGAFGELGVQVIGMSADSVRRQKNFADKQSLPYPLLSDEERVVLEAWGVWGETQMYGRTFEGIHRSTFLFDADGKVVRAWPKVKVKGHVDEVLQAARERFG